MKHIFVVHSPVTYITAVGITLKLNLNKGSVLVLGDNWNYINGPLTISPIEQVTLKEIFKNPIRNHKSIFHAEAKLYAQIEHFLNGDRFKAYVPILDYTKKLIVVHPMCVGFDYFEEGTEAYNYYEDIYDYTFNFGKDWTYPIGKYVLGTRFRNAINAFRFYNRKIDAMPFSYPAYAADPRITFWALSNYAFPAAVNKQILDIKVILDEFEKVGCCIPVLDNKNILIWDSRYERIFDNGKLFNILETELINKVKATGVLVKFHHKDTSLQRKKLLEFLKKKSVNYEVLKDSSIMEFVFMKSHSCKVYGIMSSLLLYAAIFGHKSFSLTKQFAQWNKEKINKTNGYKTLINII